MPKQIASKFPCTGCSLHKTCKTIAMPGWGNESASLQIWLDFPQEEADRRHKPRESKQARFVDWLLRRNSLSLQDVYVGYSLRCMVPKNFLKKKDDRLESLQACNTRWNDTIRRNAKAIVSLGEISCLAFMGATKVGTVAGMSTVLTEPFKHKVFGDYSPGYALVSPADTVSISRSIWVAAEYAGLKPKINPKELTNFDYELF